MFDWTAFENALVETAEAAIDKWFAKYPKQHPYAIAFHECYCELDGPIAIPSLGINSIEKQKHEKGTDEENYKWSPSDWHWTSILPERSPLAKLEKPLTDEACSGSQAHWNKTRKRFEKILLSVTKHLYQKYSKHPQVTDDFVVYIEDEEYGLDLINAAYPLGCTKSILNTLTSLICRNCRLKKDSQSISRIFGLMRKRFLRWERT